MFVPPDGGFLRLKIHQIRFPLGPCHTFRRGTCSSPLAVFNERDKDRNRTEGKARGRSERTRKG